VLRLFVEAASEPRAAELLAWAKEQVCA
jgi:hypothetical protein